jgi:GT2 family glycosyltransferase
MKNPKFSILIPVLITQEYQYMMTKACLQNIHGFSYDYEIILLHSIEEFHGEHLKKFLRPKKDQYIGFKENISQPAALNIGINKARGEYIILIGNDNFVHQNWLKEIDKRLGNKDVPILASCVDRMPPQEWKKYRDIHKDTNYVTHTNFPYVNFQGVTIPKKIFDDVGLFDEKFTFYLWEMDFRNRLDLKGYSVGGVIDSLMTTPQNMTRISETLPEGVTNYWTDESNKKEQEYYLEKWDREP